MYAAVLEQVAHPTNYSVTDFRRQIAHYLLTHPHQLNPFYENISGDYENYEDWVRGVHIPRTWGDETVLIAIALMWNVSISVIFPDEVLKMQHNRDVADIYLLGNGECKQGTNTHFSATGKKYIYIYISYLL